ncbi:MAG: preprotein translocase subunit SecA [candidate division WOR-3 bacterium]
MVDRIFKFVIGTRNQREVRKRWKIVQKINEIYEKLNLTPEDILKRTEYFEAALRQGAKPEELLPEAFAVAKYATKLLVGKSWTVTGIPYTWDMIYYDVQLLGGIVLFEGKIAEMATGEGKTLVATLPLYLHGLIGRIKGTGVHIATVNDYLARRDKEWMGPLYDMLGLSVGVIQSLMPTEERKKAYNADITYGTANEFGFDYLRDHMVYSREEKVQRGHYYAIVDEVDSVLIDEARTPLIISGPAQHSNVERFREMKPIVESMYKEQQKLIARFLDEAERLLGEGNIKEAARRLLQVKRGAPKNRRLFKVLQEPGIMSAVDKMESEGLKDKKIRLWDAELYYVVDEKYHSVDITEKGREFIHKFYPDLFKIPDIASEIHLIDMDPKIPPKEKFALKERIYREFQDKTEKIHAIQQLIKAYTLFEKEVDYVVMDGKVIIVDEKTGRLMPGRRWSDGLHEAVEAKEGVPIQQETQTFATITLQNYFRMYEKLAGMTGTASTEAQEFWEIYKLDVISIPTNKPVRRVDKPDIIYRTKKDKYLAMVREIEVWHKLGRPILVGTTSIEESELLSRYLRMRKIPHQVLNAKHHEREAQIVALAGQKGAVTIATNMAGRGTDIKLGPGVLDPYDQELVKKLVEEMKDDPIPTWKQIVKRGYIPPYDENDPTTWEYYGLYVMGAQRHDSRRIDNQLRGRSGRQGDPGMSKFFLSLEDDLMRLFGADKAVEMAEKFGHREKWPQESKMVTKAIENAQKRVEYMHFQMRKRLLEYDEVLNRQRKVIYTLRDRIIDGEDISDVVREFIEELVDEVIDKYANSPNPDFWDKKKIIERLSLIFLGDFMFVEEIRDRKELREKLVEHILSMYSRREEEFGREQMREIERIVLLTTLDELWKDHLYKLDHLKEGTNLRAYGQKDPLVEYKKEAFALFDETLTKIRDITLERLFRVQVVPSMPRMFVPIPQRATPDSETSNKAKSRRRGVILED